MNQLLKLRRAWAQANELDENEPVDGDVLDILDSLLKDRGAKPLPPALREVIGGINGEKHGRLVLSMLRMMRHTAGTRDERLPVWAIILDQSALYSPDEILAALDRIDFSPPPDFDPSWVEIGQTGGGEVVFVDGNSLGVWDHRPFDEQIPEHVTWVTDDLEGVLRELEACVERGGFKTEKAPDFGSHVVFQQRWVFSDTEWAERAGA